MHADGIDVLHPADGDGGVVGVAHDLKLDLFIALDGLFDQHLMNGTERKGVPADIEELFFIVGKTAAGTAEGEGGSQNHGISDLFGRLFCLIQVISDPARRSTRTSL